MADGVEARRRSLGCALGVVLVGLAEEQDAGAAVALDAGRHGEVKVERGVRAAAHAGLREFGERAAGAVHDAARGSLVGREGGARRGGEKLETRHAAERKIVAKRRLDVGKQSLGGRLAGGLRLARPKRALALGAEVVAIVAASAVASTIATTTTTLVLVGAAAKV